MLSHSLFTNVFWHYFTACSHVLPCLSKHDSNSSNVFMLALLQVPVPMVLSVGIAPLALSMLVSMGLLNQCATLMMLLWQWQPVLHSFWIISVSELLTTKFSNIYKTMLL